MWSPACACCGVADYVKLPSTRDPYVCDFCWRRDELCQHNLSTRVRNGGENVAYSSRPVPQVVRLRDGLIEREKRAWETT